MTYQELGPNGSVPQKSREESSNNKGMILFLLIKGEIFSEGGMEPWGDMFFVKYSRCRLFLSRPKYCMYVCIFVFFGSCSPKVFRSPKLCGPGVFI